MKYKKGLIVLILSLVYFQSFSQIVKLNKGQLFPFDTGVAMDLNLYRSIRFKSIECDSFINVSQKETILKDSIIGEYCGEIISEKEQHKRETNVQFEYTLELSEFIQYDDSIHKETKWYVDANNFGNLTRFINHSCKPNCEYRAYMVDGYLRCFVVALRRIRQTEELTCKYTDQNSLWFECMCSVHVRKKTSTNNI